MVRREPCAGPQCHMAGKGESGCSRQGRTSSIVSMVRLGPELRPLPTGYPGPSESGWECPGPSSLCEGSTPLETLRIK